IFFFQAEDGIRDRNVTGVQTCALPILLRERPDRPVGEILDSDRVAVGPAAPLSGVTREMATYNLVSMPVIDEDGRLLGAVTVDDVLDHVLPDDWREQDEPAPTTGQIDLSEIARATAHDTGEE